MKPSSRLACELLSCCVLLAGSGCTAPNPMYLPAEGVVPADASVPAADLRPVIVDLAPAPDLIVIAYLSDGAWASATSGWGPVEKDKSNGEQAAGDGKAITIGGMKYAKGLGVHAVSDIVYNLNGAYRTFSADVGVDDETRGAGTVIFQVYLDKVKSYDSGLVRGGQKARQVNLNVTGVKELRLSVGDSGDGNASDHADWAGARLIN